jgi:type II secretory pathway predicted ATPase ExeA
MYETFYNLAKDPFRLIPDHRFCYRHRSYVRADAYVQYALSRGEGIVLITGEPGTGKTTFSADLLARLGSDKVTAAQLVTSQLEASDFLRAVALAFGLDIQSRDKLDVLHQLEGFLAQQHEKSRRALLIVDEAHELLDSAFTELRLLTNLVQAEGQPLLQVILLGQKDILETLHAPRMEQLRQRVVAGRHLQPLDADETQAYIEHRLTQAGWSGNPTLDGDLYRIIHEQAGGIPRVINLLCSRLLLYGALEERHELTSSDLELVIEGLRREQLLPRYSKAAVDRTQPAGMEPSEAVTQPPETTRKHQHLFAALSTAARKTTKSPSFRRTWVPAAGAVAAGFVSWIALSNFDLIRPDLGGESAVHAPPLYSDESMYSERERYDESVKTSEIALAAEAATGPAPTVSEEARLPPADVATSEAFTSAPESAPAVASSERNPSAAPLRPAARAVVDTEQDLPLGTEMAAFERRWQQLEEETDQRLVAETASAAVQDLSPEFADTVNAETTQSNVATAPPSAEPDAQPAQSDDSTELGPEAAAAKETLAMTEELPLRDAETSLSGPMEVIDGAAGEVEKQEQASADSSPAPVKAPVKKPASDPTGELASGSTGEVPTVLARTEPSSPVIAPREAADNATANRPDVARTAVPEAELDATLFRASRLAIVPFQTGTGCAWPIETVMVETILDLIKANDSLELTYSFYDGDGMARQTGPPPDVWRNASSLESPDPAAAYAIGARLGVALVVTAQIECAQSSGIYEDWRPFDIYLYDIERKKFHHHRNSLKNLTKGTRKVFSDFLAARGLALQSQ